MFVFYMSVYYRYLGDTMTCLWLLVIFFISGNGFIEGFIYCMIFIALFLRGLFYSRSLVTRFVDYIDFSMGFRFYSSQLENTVDSFLKIVMMLVGGDVLWGCCFIQYYMFYVSNRQLIRGVVFFIIRICRVRQYVKWEQFFLLCF